MRETEQRLRREDRWRKALLGLALLLAATAPAAGGTGLVWHVETAGGEPVDSRREDAPINPASIVKVATSLWALETLGPRHRFETVFGYRGSLDSERGVLEGDLVVIGGRDPDFHVENAFLVARWLNAAGIERVEGRLIVCGDFWIGWEGGSEGTYEDTARRGERMALRLRDAIDHRRWSRGTRAEWGRFAARRAVPITERPRVVVRRGVAVEAPQERLEVLVVHRSNELPTTLKRFNAYSNNDIERFANSLGSAGDLSRYVADRWGDVEAPIRFETLSGLGTNRMSPRQVVRLMRDFRETSRSMELAVEDVLPLAGCDPGTMTQFPRLNEGGASRVVAGKTGTLTHTDNGITTLAGYLYTSTGERVFCVAFPNASGRISTARRAEETWLLERIERYGGPEPRACGRSPWHSDADARLIEPPDATPSARYLPGHSATTAGSIPLLP